MQVGMHGDNNVLTTDNDNAIEPDEPFPNQIRERLSQTNTVWIDALRKSKHLDKPIIYLMRYFIEDLGRARGTHLLSTSNTWNYFVF